VESGLTPAETERRRARAGVDAPVSSELGGVEQSARRIDAALVRRCRSGDPAGWSEIVERFSGYVYAIVVRFGLSDDRAQDVYQEVFTRAFTHLESLRDEHALKPWIAQLTRRAAIDRLRADARETIVDAVEFVQEPDLEEIERAMSVQRALDGLPEPYGEVLRRFFVYDQSYRMIGEALRIPSGTVASRISRGLSMLRKVLEPDA
jgi:RNA polymerase sigma factor (sigma-70 family)